MRRRCSAASESLFPGGMTCTASTGAAAGDGNAGKRAAAALAAAPTASAAMAGVAPGGAAKMGAAKGCTARVAAPVRVGVGESTGRGIMP